MSLMRDYISGETIAHTVRMCRTAQAPKKPLVLVEGDTDVRIYRWAIEPLAEVVPGDGKAKNLEAFLQLQNDEGVSGWLIVIVDADFDRLMRRHPHQDVLLTDLHDIECEYLKSPALEKVIDELASPEKCSRAFGGEVAHDRRELAKAVREAILASAKVIGAARLLSQTKGYGMSFQNLDHTKLLVPRTLEIEGVHAMEVLLAAGATVSLNPDWLWGKVESVLSVACDLWQLCQGHDLVSLFAIGMRRLWGKGNLREEEAQRGLRLSYEGEFFWATDLGHKLAHRLREMGALPTGHDNRSAKTTNCASGIGNSRSVCW